MEYKTQVINGTTYAYIDTAFWNSSKKRGEHKRKYIGKILDGVFEYSGAAEPLFRKSGNRLSGIGNRRIA